MKALAIALALFAAPAAAATSSADLDTLSASLNAATAPSTTLDKAVLVALKEPAKTLYKISLPTTAAKYTASVETALKLMPPGWRISIYQAADGTWYCAMLHDGDPAAGWVNYETFGYSKGGRAVSMTAGIVQAWAWELRQQGR